jgi:hypothetical protein
MCAGSKNILGFTIVETSSIISLLTNIDPIRACSASMLAGCLLL